MKFNITKIITLITDVASDVTNNDGAEIINETENVVASASNLYIVLSVLLLIICIALVVIILLQKERASGLGTAIAGAGGSSQTFWDQNKSRSKEGQLDFFTKILGIAFFILVFALGFVF